MYVDSNCRRGSSLGGEGLGNEGYNQSLYNKIDTIFGVDFIVLAPEHELVASITTWTKTGHW